MGDNAAIMSPEEAAQQVGNIARDTTKNALELAEARNGMPLWLITLIVVIVAIVVTVAAILVIRFRRKEARRKERRRTARESALNARRSASHSPAPSATSLRVGKLHEQGARDEQQDSFYVTEDNSIISARGLLAVVCDGMGGMANGAMVSERAARAAANGFLECPEDANPYAILVSLATEANMSVNRMLGPEGREQSGSTMVMALVRDGLLSFANIGDSRICLFRDGELMQLNRDHLYVHELSLRAINGEMPLRDALSNPQGSGLVSYLGMGELASVDLPSSPLQLRRNDVVILMTDGVYNALTNEEILGALGTNSPQDAADALHKQISQKAFPDQDNYTAVIITCD